MYTPIEQTHKSVIWSAHPTNIPTRSYVDLYIRQYQQGHMTRRSTGSIYQQGHICRSITETGRHMSLYTETGRPCSELFVLEDPHIHCLF